MRWTTIEPLVFLWWNTSLSPPVSKNRTSAEDLAFVVSLVGELRAEYGFAAFGLGEVCSEDLRAIQAGVGDAALSVFDATDRCGRRKYDTAILYDRTKLVFSEPRSFEEKFGKTTLKLGEMARFVTTGSGEVVDVVVSHWPGRRTSPELDVARDELGTLLRRSLEYVRNAEARERPYVILMGDFNDDPYSRALTGHLLATRDRELARRRAEFFYNPFWRCLGESLPSVMATAEQGVCGTHYYPSGASSHWFTFDQIIFSSAFLGDGPIVLDDAHSRILSTPELKRRLLDKKQIFDHFPVLSAVTLRSPSCL
jgi:hypothetical protein